MRLWNTVAHSGIRSDRPTSNRRRGAVFGALLKAAEVAAFGSGVDSPRSVWTSVPLEAPVEEPDDGDIALVETLVGTPDIAPGVLARLEIDDVLFGSIARLHPIAGERIAVAHLLRGR